MGSERIDAATAQAAWVAQMEVSEGAAREAGDVLVAVNELRAEVAKLVSAQPSALPLVAVSVSRAARILGVSKARSLMPAIAEGIVRTVVVGRRVRIAPAELRRLAEQGVVAPPHRPRKRRATPAHAPADPQVEAARVLAIRP